MIALAQQAAACASNEVFLTGLNVVQTLALAFMADRSRRMRRTDRDDPPGG